MKTARAAAGEDAAAAAAEGEATVRPPMRLPHHHVPPHRLDCTKCYCDAHAPMPQSPPAVLRARPAGVPRPPAPPGIQPPCMTHPHHVIQRPRGAGLDLVNAKDSAHCLRVWLGWVGGRGWELSTCVRLGGAGHADTLTAAMACKPSPLQPSLPASGGCHGSTPATLKRAALTHRPTHAPNPRVP